MPRLSLPGSHFSVQRLQTFTSVPSPPPVFTVFKMHVIAILLRLLFIATTILGECTSSKPMVPLITLEEHYLSEAFASYPSLQPLYADPAFFPPNTKAKLLALGEPRLQDMNAGNVSWFEIFSRKSQSAPPLGRVSEAANKATLPAAHRVR